MSNVTYESVLEQAQQLPWLERQRLLKTLNRPVWAFVDYDPAGLVIALALPSLQGIIVPEVEVLAKLLDKHGLEDRYRMQLPAAAPSLDCTEHPAVAWLWPMLRQAGRALPQEIFIGLG